jgi:ribosomal protein S18 acetylase RimI-like enzyme
MEFAVLGVDSENPSGAYHIYEALGFVPERRSVAYIKKVGEPKE